MDDKIKLGALILAGYVLGRTKKMKLALTLAGAVAGNKLRDDSQREALLGSLGGIKSSVLSSPEVKRLTNEVSGKLVVAGKAAALAAATRGIDSLNSTLQARTEKLQAPLARDEEEPEDEYEVPAEDEYDEAEEPAEDEAEEPAEDEAEEPAEDEAEEPAEDEAEEPEEEPAPKPRSRSTRQKKDSGEGKKATTSRSSSGRSSSGGSSSGRSSSGRSSSARSSSSRSSSSGSGSAAKKSTTTRRRQSSGSRQAS